MRAEDFVELLNYVGIVAFALSGALKAGEKDMDLLGFVVLGFSTALAGGIIRDLLLGRVPPVNVVYMPYSLTAIAASLAAF
ncbi:MAG: trimeric intracellular cation channel family protein, partial [Pyrobaculum sp.]